MPMAQPFTGVFRFPGIFAFLEQAGVPDDALLQSDDPFTGVFDDVEARVTCNALRARHQDGDRADLTGQIRTCQVNGRNVPVLFLFN